MMGSEHVSYLVAFFAGTLMFLSPCLLPLVPSFIAYITGISFADLKEGRTAGEVRVKAFAHSLAFVAGFSVVFVLLGLTATAVGKTLFQYQRVIRVAGGLLITFFGLYLVGALKFGFMERGFRLNLRPKDGPTGRGPGRAGYLGSVSYTHLTLPTILRV